MRTIIFTVILFAAVYLSANAQPGRNRQNRKADVELNQEDIQKGIEQEREAIQKENERLR